MQFFYPPEDQIYFFSTHAWAHLHWRDGLHRLLSPWRKGADFLDLSVTSRHPLDTDTDAQLRAELRDRIEICDMLLVMAGMYLIDREWMEFEIITAHALRKPIIPIVWSGQERIPEFARSYAWCEPVRWRGDSIRDAIWHFLPEHRRLAFRQRQARAAAAAFDGLYGLGRHALATRNAFPSRLGEAPRGALEEPSYADLLGLPRLPPSRVLSPPDPVYDSLAEITGLPRQRPHTVVDDALAGVDAGVFGALNRARRLGER